MGGRPPAHNRREVIVPEMPGPADPTPAPAPAPLAPLRPDPSKRVAIVGTSHSWSMAPFDDPSIEIWGVNNGFIQLKDRRKTRWFDVHHFEHRADGKWYRRWAPEFRGQAVSDYIKHLAELGCPVYMQQAWPEIPNSVRFPVEKVNAYFGRYITNSISMQMAYALTEGFGEIQLWGIDMSAGTEWAYQRPNAEFFIGLAAGIGAKVLVPPESDLLKTAFMYAYEERDKHDWIKKSELLERKLAQKRDAAAAEVMRLERELEFRRRVVEQHTGALQGIKDMKHQWVHDLGHWHYPES